MSDARIEAAGHAIYFAWNNTPYLREVAPPEEGECMTFAEHALAAADSVERGLADQLAREAIAHVREHYSESIFPPRPPGQHSEVYDGEAASVARLTCDNILREFEERLARFHETQERAIADSAGGSLRKHRNEPEVRRG